MIIRNGQVVLKSTVEKKDLRTQYKDVSHILTEQEFLDKNFDW